MTKLWWGDETPDNVAHLLAVGRKTRLYYLESLNGEDRAAPYYVKTLLSIARGFHPLKHWAEVLGVPLERLTFLERSAKAGSRAYKHDVPLLVELLGRVRSAEVEKAQARRAWKASGHVAGSTATHAKPRVDRGVLYDILADKTRPLDQRLDTARQIAASHYDSHSRRMPAFPVYFSHWIVAMDGHILNPEEVEALQRQHPPPRRCRIAHGYASWDTAGRA